VLPSTTGVPLASSSMFTVPEGTPPEPLTVTVRLVKVVVSPDVGQACVPDCAAIVVVVVVKPKAHAP
jgi:hypothetical protein